MKILFYGLIVWCLVIWLILFLSFWPIPAHAMKLGNMNFKIEIPETPQESIFQEFGQKEKPRCMHDAAHEAVRECIDTGKPEDAQNCNCWKIVYECGHEDREGSCWRAL